MTGVPCLHLSSQPGVSARRESEERLERKNMEREKPRERERGEIKPTERKDEKGGGGKKDLLIRNKDWKGKEKCKRRGEKEE